MGSPVGMRTASSLEKAIEESISLQPYVRRVEVRIDRDMLSENVFGYGELEGRMIWALVEIEYEGEVISARLEYDRERSYPLMSLK
ncbi:MAG: hypothetical protein STSR0001_16000 [Methanothrix sp.]